MLRRLLIPSLTIAVTGAVPVAMYSASDGGGSSRLNRIKHIVVIYEENHSFDNLYGSWEGVNGCSNADAATNRQVGQAGTPILLPAAERPNLTSPPLSATCTDTTTGGAVHQSLRERAVHDRRLTFQPDMSEHRVPTAASRTDRPGGCTRDLVHRFYQEQYQLNGGRRTGTSTGSDAVGLTMGAYDTRTLPIYRYLHEDGHPHYAIADASSRRRSADRSSITSG